MPSVQSRVNGLIINIPADARGVVGRFNTQGGNELIFAQTKHKADNDRMSIGGTKPAKKKVAKPDNSDLA